MSKPYIKFNKKNMVSCVDIKFTTIIFEYMLWVLGGKPDSHYIGYQKNKIK